MSVSYTHLIVKGDVDKGIFIGELGFDGSIRAVDGVLAFVLKAKELNYEYIICLLYTSRCV